MNSCQLMEELHRLQVNPCYIQLKPQAQSKVLTHSSSKQEQRNDNVVKWWTKWSIQVSDSSVITGKHGFSAQKSIWNLPSSMHIVVKLGKTKQPIGNEAGVLGTYEGYIGVVF